MANTDSEINRKKKLRARALELMHKDPRSIAGLPSQDIAELTQELGVYQMELEMQNEELRKAHVELENSRQKYSDLYDFAPVGYFVLDKDGVIIEGNLTGAMLLGVERSAMIGKHFFRFVYQADKEKHSSFRRKLMENPEGQNLELRLLRNNTDPFNALLQGRAISNSEGGVLQCRIAVTDITERKQAEYALHLSQESLALAVNEAKIGIFDWDVLTGKVAWTVQHEIIFGYEPTTTTTTTTTVPHSYEDFLKRLHPDDVSRVEEKIRQAMSDRTLFQAEYRVVWPDGSLHWVSGSGQFHYDSSGRAIRMVGAIQEITERKTAEQQLEYLASFPENNPSPVLETDLSGRIFYINPAAKETFPDLQAQGLDHPFLMGLGAIAEACEKDKKKSLSREIQAYDVWFEQSFLYFADSKLLRIYGLDITKRKAAEVALKENQARLRRVLHGSNDGFWDWNLADGKIFVSARWWQIAGMKGSVRDLRIEDMDHLIHPEDLPKVQAAMMPVIEGRAGKDQYEVVCRYCRSDGSMVWVLMRAAVIDRDASGRAKQVSGATTDISARIRAEEALTASELRYRRLFESAKDGILILNAETGMVDDVNPFLIEKLGLSREVFLGKKIWELGFFKNIVANQDKFKELQEKEFIRYEDLPLEAGDGRKIDVEFVSNVYRVNAHKVIQCNIRDISERKRAEEALRANEERYRNLVIASPEAIVVHQAGRIVFANPVALELFRAADKKELLGRSVLSLISKTSRVYAKQRLRQTPTEAVPKVEIEFVRLDGALFEGEVMGQGVMFEGKPGVHFVIRDISERKKIDEILKRDQEMLKKLVDEKAIKLMEAQQEIERSKRLSDIGVLAATVAHELRTPLGVIRVAAYNIKQKAPGPLLERNLENIEKKVMESNQIINNLLFYSRFRKATLERVRVYDLLEECVQSASDRFHDRGAALEKKYASIKDVWGELDPLQIKEVFNNMLVNAFEAIPRGKGRVKVAARCDAEKLEMAITFEDNGVGIPEEDLARIREPFFTTKSKGTGLGLTVCHQIVANHKGRIDVASEKGKGTIFTVILPCAAWASA